MPAVHWQPATTHAADCSFPSHPDESGMGAWTGAPDGGMPPIPRPLYQSPDRAARRRIVQRRNLSPGAHGPQTLSLQHRPLLITLSAHLQTLPIKAFRRQECE
jgi:hypothetical protein